MRSHNIKKIKLLANYHADKGRYLLGGAWNSLFGYFIGLILYAQFGEVISLLAILVISNCLAITNAFLVNKMFVFRARGNWIEEYLKSYLTYGFGALISIFLIWTLVELAHFKYWIAQTISLVIGFVISYFLNKNFTFKKL